MNYDIAVGMDNSTLNTLLAQAYHALYPNLLKNSINIGRVGIASIGFDINAAPTVTLSPSADANAYFEAAIADNTYEDFANLDDDSKSFLLNLANAASFDLNLPSIVLTINYISGKPPTSVTASLAGALNIQTTNNNGQNLLIVQLLSATISIASDPFHLADILNQELVPRLIPYLNEHIFHSIQIPPLRYHSLQVSMPVPVVQTPYLTCYSALGSTQPDIPSPYHWPTGCVYVGLDVAALQAAAGTVFPLGPSTGFNWQIFSGQVGAQVQAPNHISINADGSLTAALVANAEAQLTLHMPNGIPNINFGPSATATLTATLRPSVNNGEFMVSIESVPIPIFIFDWGTVGWLPILIPFEVGLSVALNAALLPLLSEALISLSILKFPLHPSPIKFHGSEINIALDNVTTSGQNSLLLVSAQATVS